MRLNPLTHLLHFKEEWRNPIRVTEKQVVAWETAKAKNATLTLKDEGFWTDLYRGDPWAFREATTIIPPKRYVFICPYRNRHPVHSECDCYEKYKVPYWEYLAGENYDP